MAVWIVLIVVSTVLFAITLVYNKLIRLRNKVAAAVVKLLFKQLPVKGSASQGHDGFSEKFTERGVRLNELCYLADSRFPIDC
jgi:hypothetical protein